MGLNETQLPSTGVWSERQGGVVCIPSEMETPGNGRSLQTTIFRSVQILSQANFIRPNGSSGHELADLVVGDNGNLILSPDGQLVSRLVLGTYVRMAEDQTTDGQSPLEQAVIIIGSDRKAMGKEAKGQPQLATLNAIAFEAKRQARRFLKAGITPEECLSPAQEVVDIIRPLIEHADGPVPRETKTEICRQVYPLLKRFDPAQRRLILRLAQMDLLVAKKTDINPEVINHIIRGLPSKLAYQDKIRWLEQRIDTSGLKAAEVNRAYRMLQAVPDACISDVYEVIAGESRFRSKDKQERNAGKQALAVEINRYLRELPSSAITEEYQGLVAAAVQSGRSKVTEKRKVEEVRTEYERQRQLANNNPFFLLSEEDLNKALMSRTLNEARYYGLPLPRSTDIASSPSVTVAPTTTPDQQDQQTIDRRAFLLGPGNRLTRAWQEARASSEAQAQAEAQTRAETQAQAEATSEEALTRREFALATLTILIGWSAIGDIIRHSPGLQQVLNDFFGEVPDECGNTIFSPTLLAPESSQRENGASSLRVLYDDLAGTVKRLLNNDPSTQEQPTRMNYFKFIRNGVTHEVYISSGKLQLTKESARNLAQRANTRPTKINIIWDATGFSVNYSVYPIDSVSAKGSAGQPETITRNWFASAQQEELFRAMEAVKYTGEHWPQMRRYAFFQDPIIDEYETLTGGKKVKVIEKLWTGSLGGGRGGGGRRH